MRQAVANSQTRATAQPGETSGDERLLRLIAAGDVGAGKSTLVARLLRESEGAQERPLPDPPAQDVLAAASYRCFATVRRQFAAVDPPGHRRFPHTIVAAAPAAGLALVVVDAHRGLTPGARYDCAVAALFGIRRLVIAVSKLDLVEYAEDPFRRIQAQADGLRALPGIEGATCLPVSGLYGDNVLTRGGRLSWYDGPTLLEHLESVPLEDPPSPFRLWVQRAPPPGADLDGFAGTVVGGRAAPGDRVAILPSGRQSRIRRIVAYDGEIDHAISGQSVTLELEDELELERGDLVSSAVQRAGVGDQFETTLAWMADEPLVPGRGYLIAVGTQTAPATIGPLKHRLNVLSLKQVAGGELGREEIGACDVLLGRRIAFDPHGTNRDTGAFVVLDPATRDPLGAGLLHRALRESEDVCWQPVDVDRDARAAIKHQRPCIVWLTGLPSAGKSTIANLLERRLHGAGYHTYLLDGDNIRHGLNKDLGFSREDRFENIRRVGEVAKLMVDAGLIVICSFISPFAAERREVRRLVASDEFVEVYVDAPIEVAEGRDTKGLYARARRGELTGLTGVDSPYEPPEDPEVHLAAGSLTAEESAQRVLDALLDAGVIDASAAV